MRISDDVVPEKLKQVEVLFKGYTRAAFGNSLDDALRVEAKLSAAYWRTVAALLAQRQERLRSAYVSKHRQVGADNH